MRSAMLYTQAPIVFIPRRHQAAPNIEPSYHWSDAGLYESNKGDDSTLLNALTVAPSMIHGLGLFAKRTYVPHDTIWYESLRGGRRIEDEGPLRWTNHSDNPNCMLILCTDEGLQARLVALRTIAMGDEITYNYTRFGHSGSRTACNCGNPACHGSFVMREEWGERR